MYKCNKIYLWTLVLSYVIAFMENESKILMNFLFKSNFFLKSKIIDKVKEMQVNTIHNIHFSNCLCIFCEFTYLEAIAKLLYMKLCSFFNLSSLTKIRRIFHT